MAIGLWSAGSTLRQDPLFDLCEWYLLLCSFYPPPMRGDDEPFFLNPRLFPERLRVRCQLVLTIWSNTRLGRSAPR